MNSIMDPTDPNYCPTCGGECTADCNRKTTDAPLVAIAKGDRVRVGGTSYDAVEDATIRAALAPASNPQRNRHLKVHCTNPTCVSRAQTAGLSPWSVRATRAMFLRGLPRCGECDGIWDDKTLHTCQPDGWTFADLPEDERDS